MDQASSSLKDSIRSLGVVFGDIGTSPIYTLSAIFACSFMPVTRSNVMGVASLIIWTLILLVTVQYAWLAMSLASEESGEGGVIVLRETLVSLLKSPKATVVATFLSFLGISFFIGDGIITPAISILSAVEGLKFVPLLATGITQRMIVIVALLIAFGLFAVQKRGTDSVSRAFGPIMLIWFLFLAISGLIFVVQYPFVLRAINPLYACKFFIDHGMIGIILLSKIILCATGAEALFQDMGHLGRVPTIRAWGFVFCCLVLVYLGQAAFILAHPEVRCVFYGMILVNFKPFYTPLVILGIMASVIASQALISGLFSITYQCITTHIMPRLYVEYTSRRFMSQIYIPAVNKFLFILVVFAIVTFKCSENLTLAYGLAASGLMTITAFFLTWIFVLRKNIFKAIIAGALLLVNSVFAVANTYKIPDGGYVSLLIACLPLGFIAIYTLGRRRLMQLLKQTPADVFVERFSLLSSMFPHINGTAVFMCRSISQIPPYVVQTMFTNNIIYEDNIIVFMKTLPTPFGLVASFKEDLAPGLRVFEIRMGYLEIVDIEKIFNVEHIHPKVIFYGVEEILTKNLFWQFFTAIKKLTPSFVQFYKLPRNKLHGVLIRIDM